MDIYASRDGERDGHGRVRNVDKQSAKERVGRPRHVGRTAAGDWRCVFLRGAPRARGAMESRTIPADRRRGEHGYMGAGTGNHRKGERKADMSMAAKKIKSKSWKINDWQLFSLAMAGVLFLCVFCYGPMFGIILAFKDGDGVLNITDALTNTPWAGFANFEAFFRDPNFKDVLVNTLGLNLLQLLDDLQTQQAGLELELGYRLSCSSLRRFSFRLSRRP